VKLDIKQSPTITKFGVEYLNPEHHREWQQKVRQELKKTVKENSDMIKKNMRSWKPSTHKEFSETLQEFKNGVNELLASYPHQIVPEFLSVIIDVRERARGVLNQSEMLSEKEFFEKRGVDYKEFHTSRIESESHDIHDLFSKLLKLLYILDKNVGPGYK